MHQKAQRKIEHIENAVEKMNDSLEPPPKKSNEQNRGEEKASCVLQ